MFVSVSISVNILCFQDPCEYVTEVNVHSSCEIEDFVEARLCKLCVVLRSRVLRVVCAHSGYRSNIYRIHRFPVAFRLLLGIVYG